MKRGFYAAFPIDVCCQTLDSLQSPSGHDVDNDNDSEPSHSDGKDAGVFFRFDDNHGDNGLITCGIMDLVDRLHLTTDEPTSKRNVRTSSSVAHVQQFDRWSCGFRNLQMLLTAVLPNLGKSHAYYRKFEASRHVKATKIPTLIELQRSLEQAWKEGYDSKGATHFQNKIVGKASKIGAVEVASLMSFWGMDAALVQFIECQESRKVLPRFVKAYFAKKTGKHACPFCFPEMMTSEVRAAGLLQVAERKEEVRSQPTCHCPSLPLYLQWEGHSVTIVGIETVSPSDGHSRIQDNLLVLDPLKDGTEIRDVLFHHKSLEQMRLPLHLLAGKDTQLVLCSMCSLSSAELVERREQVCSHTAAREHVLRVTRSSNEDDKAKVTIAPEVLMLTSNKVAHPSIL